MRRIGSTLRACLPLLACGVAATVWAAEEEPSGPQIVSTSPAVGASAVDGATSEIRVTFDEEMQGGFSWTGGGEAFPEVTAKPHWETDKRTCVLPVKLEPAKFYRVGINSTSHQNFRGASGAPAEFAVIYFVTAGADKTTLAKLVVPKVVDLVPDNGAETVAASRSNLTVTFDRPMGPGFSWTDVGGTFPKITEAAQWNEDRTVCTLPVSLQPGTTYRLGLNHAYANNFQSEHGVPLAPVVWTFTTAAE